MELAPNTGLLSFVDDPVFDFGEVSETDIIEYNFPFKGTPDQIQYIEKGCGCTSAFFKDNSIQGSLDISKAGGPYPAGETPVTKYVFIYLNDGVDRFIGDDMKQRQVNPAKSFFKVTLTGKVIK